MAQVIAERTQAERSAFRGMSMHLMVVLVLCLVGRSRSEESDVVDLTPSRCEEATLPDSTLQTLGVQFRLDHHDARVSAGRILRAVVRHASAGPSVQGATDATLVG
jgi:hypothetical protein